MRSDPCNPPLGRPDVANLPDYAWLIGDEGAPWLERLARDERTELQQLDALRRDLSAERARLVVEQVALRRRAAEKFGDLAGRMFFTRTLLEQATDIAIARYKATRLTRGANNGIVDYCCGIGGDLLPLSQASLTTGWDRSEVACLLAKANAPDATVNLGDVEEQIPPRGMAWHVDPDRRASGRRTTAISAYAPGPETIARWLVANKCGAVKLAPAAVVPPEWEQGELEWITRDGECRQQVAWFGPFVEAPGRRFATIVGQHGPADMFSGEPEVFVPAREEVGQHVYDPDPSILAGHLLGALASELGLNPLGHGGAYLTSDEYRYSSFAAAFRVRDCLPLRLATIAKYCTAHGIGRLEIKKRGVATAPESLRRRLRLSGDNVATLLLTRIGKREVAIVAERVAS
jgi:hypothetical protein